MEMIKRVNRQALFLLLPLALLSALIEWKRLPAGILVGGALGLANLKGLYWGVGGVMNPESADRAKGRLVFFSIFRLSLVFVLLGILIYLRLINIFGVLTGFTIVFIIVMKEGLRETKTGD